MKPFYPETGAVTRIDDFTAQFNLLEPNVFFPGALTGQLGYVSSPTWIAAALDDPTLNQKPVGTGPFVFDSRSPDSVTRFVRNDAWWNGEVYLDAVEFVPVPDADTRAELLLEGDINALQTSDPGAILKLDEDPSIQQVKDETAEESFAMINSGSPPFDDIRAREALTLATPEENYLNLIGLGVLRPATQRFIPESKYYNPDVTMQMDDPAAAKVLSDEYCGEFPENCSDGKINMELQYPAGSVVLDQTADLLIQGWGESFNVTVQTIPQDQHIQEAALGQYNVVLWRQFGAEDPALDNVWLLCRTVGGISLNWPKFCDESRDASAAGGPGHRGRGRPDRSVPADRAEAARRLPVHLLRPHAVVERVRRGRPRRVRPRVARGCAPALRLQRTQLVLVHLDLRVRLRRNPEHHEILGHTNRGSDGAPAGGQHAGLRRNESPG